MSRSRQDHEPGKSNRSDLGFAGRIKTIIDLIGTADKLAELSGVSARSIGKYLAGDSDPSRARLAMLAKAANVRFLWLGTGEGPMRREGEAQGGELILSEEYVAVRSFNIRHSVGLEPEGVSEKPCIFKKSWIKNMLMAEPSNLSFIEIDVPDMEPTLQMGQIALVDEGKTSLVKDGIYFIGIGSSVTVKRLRRISRNTIEVISDDQSIKPYIILDLGDGTYAHVAVKELGIPQQQADVMPPQEGHSVLGKVIWTGRRL